MILPVFRAKARQTDNARIDVLLAQPISMRSLSQSVIARSIIMILLFSVLTPVLLYDEKVVEVNELEELEEIEILSASGRAKANHYLVKGGGSGFEYASV
nr:hypothetical protein [Candidatus Poseidoniaceae archaeon]